MMISLSQQRIQAAAAVAAREQARTDSRGVLGVATRIEGEAAYTGHWDLVAVFEHLHRATDLQWRGHELTARTRGDVTRHFDLVAPGAGAPGAADITIVASADLDQVLDLAGQVSAGDQGVWDVWLSDGGVVFGTPRAPRAPRVLAQPVAVPMSWAMTCGFCPGEPEPFAEKGEAVSVAADHDREVHAGVMTAEVVSVASLARTALGAFTSSRPPVLPVRAAVGWEVDDADGTRLYLGADLQLAEEIYHSSPPGSHLLPAPGDLTLAGRSS